MSEITTAIILIKKQPRKDGTYPVRLRITFNRVQRFFSLEKHKSLSESDFEKTKSKQSLRGDLKNAQLFYAEIEKKAKDIIEDMPDFSFEMFIKKFRVKNSSIEDVFYFYSQYIMKLESEGRIKTAFSYKNSYVSIKKFSKKEKLAFIQVTPAFLQSYEIWMKNLGNSITTVGFYIRSLRTIFNEAIQEGIVKPEYYPFGKRKYIIPAPRNIKKALALEEIRKIYHYQPSENSQEERYLAYWIFSFLCNGINMKDLARLKYKNIQGDNIEIIRAKTERTSRKNLKPITAHVLDKMKEIIDLYGNKNHKVEDYVFPILKAGLTPLEESKRIDNTIRLVNKYMSRIAKELELSKEVTTYTARHSYATLMRNEGASNEYIAEKFGHSDPKVTSNYLDSFPDELQKAWAEKMVNALSNI